jgi:hypothetical protein
VFLLLPIERVAVGVLDLVVIVELVIVGLARAVLAIRRHVQAHDAAAVVVAGALFVAFRA